MEGILCGLNWGNIKTGAAPIDKEFFVVISGEASFKRAAFAASCIQLADRAEGEGEPACADDAYAGNAEPGSAAPLGPGLTEGLVTCTPSDWFLIDVPEGAGDRQAGVEVRVRYELGNLDLALHPADDLLALHPVAEAATDRVPEVLRVAHLAAGPRLLAVTSWAGAGEAPVVPYELELTFVPLGMCDLDGDCPAGTLCEEHRCVDAGGCPGRCPPLHVCDADGGVCVPRCEADAFGGDNGSRDAASPIEPGVHEGLTICDGEEDWFAVQAEAGDRVVVRVEGDDVGGAGDLDLELWGESPDQPIARSAVDGLGTTRGDLGGSGRFHDERAKPAHLLLEQADGVFQGAAAQGVAADELGEEVALVGGAAAVGAHLEEANRSSATGELPGALAAGEATTDDGDRRGQGLSGKRGDQALWSAPPATRRTRPVSSREAMISAASEYVNPSSTARASG